MYLSKYFTCEEIDQRLLQGYYDDFVKAGYVGTIQEFWAFVLSITQKVDKKDGYGLSKNDFTDELLAKLNGIEDKANYITKISQLENDSNYQTQEQVKKLISDLVDGADDALDTLKELAEALGNDPNFATTITNKLTDLRNELLAEVTRAKEAEATLDNKITQLNSDITNKIKEFGESLNATINELKSSLKDLSTKVDEDIANLAAYKTEMATNLAQMKAEGKAYVDQETNRAKEAEAALVQADHDLKVQHTRDKADLQAAIQNETTARETADKNLTDSLAAEQQARIQEDASIRSEFAKADQEIKDKYIPWTDVSNTELPKRKAIVLPTYGDVILATGPDGRTFSIAQLNRWGVMDFGSGSFPINLNTPTGVRPTAQEAGTSGEEAHDLAYLSDVNKWFGKIIEVVPEQYLESATIQVLPALEQSYIDDLGYPDTINGVKYVQGSAALKIGDPYLTVGYFDEAFNFHYHLFTNSTVYAGKIYWSMMDLARQGKEANEKLKEEIQNITSDSEGVKEELLQAIQNEATARQEADSQLDEKKVDKVEGYGLSENDFTDELLAKLNAIEEGANKITALSQLLNDCDFQNSTQVNAAIEKVIGSAPEVLDTLEEIAKALGDDPNFASTITKKLAAITEDLNDEVANRESSEQEIKASITNLSTQVDTKIANAKKEVEDDLAVEVQARKDGDTALQNNLNTEISERQNADTNLQAQITQELSDRQAADNNLQTQITNLATQFGNAGSSLKEYVDGIKNTLEARFVQDEALINQNVQNIQNNLELIQGIQKSLESVNTSITNLQELLNQEIKSRQDGDKLLQQNIDNVASDLTLETQQRKAEDEILQSNIDKLASDTSASIESLLNKHNQDLQTEKSERQAADQIIQGQVDSFPNNIRVGEVPQATVSDFSIFFTYKYKDGDKKYTGESQNKVTIPAASTTQAGVMTAADKNQLEQNKVDIQTEITNRTQADQALDDKIEALQKTHEDEMEALKTDYEARISALESQVAQLIQALTLK